MCVTSLFSRYCTDIRPLPTNSLLCGHHKNLGNIISNNSVHSTSKSHGTHHHHAAMSPLNNKNQGMLLTHVQALLHKSYTICKVYLPIRNGDFGFKNDLYILFISGSFYMAVNLRSAWNIQIYFTQYFLLYPPAYQNIILSNRGHLCVNDHLLEVKLIVSVCSGILTSCKSCYPCGKVIIKQKQRKWFLNVEILVKLVTRR